MVKSGSDESRWGSLVTIRCSARKSKWAPKWANFRLVADVGEIRIPAVKASLRVKLPRAVLRLSLVSRCSVAEGSSSTVRESPRFFGLFQTRKVGSRLSRWLRRSKAKALPIPDRDSDGTVSLGDVHRESKSIEPAVAAHQKIHHEGDAGRRWRLPSQFADEKKTWATLLLVGVLLSTVLLPSRLGIARAVWRAAFTAIAPLAVALVLNSFGFKNRPSAELRKLWEQQAARVGAKTVSPQVTKLSIRQFDSVEDIVRRIANVVSNTRVTCSIAETTFSAFGGSKQVIRVLLGSAALVAIARQLSPSSWGP